jgi:hypothetical protein
VLIRQQAFGIPRQATRLKPPVGKIRVLSVFRAAELKRRATDAVNERLRPIRERRTDLMTDRGYLRRVLLDGSAAARTLAQDTLTQVSAAMHTQY